MTIKVTCSKCAKTFEVSDKFGGKTGPCPNCKAQIRVPDLSKNFVVHNPKNWFDKQDELMAKSAAVRKTSTSTSGNPSQMPTILLLTVIALLLLGTLGVQVVSVFQRRNAWEYMITSPSDIDFQRSLDNHGKNGWELVTARRASNSNSLTIKFSYECIFKRRK